MQQATLMWFKLDVVPQILRAIFCGAILVRPRLCSSSDDAHAAVVKNRDRNSCSHQPVSACFQRQGSVCPRSQAVRSTLQVASVVSAWYARFCQETGVSCQSRPHFISSVSIVSFTFGSSRAEFIEPTHISSSEQVGGTLTELTKASRGLTSYSTVRRPGVSSM